MLQKIINENEFFYKLWIYFDSDTNNKKRYIFSCSNVKEFIGKSNNNKIELPEKLASFVHRIEAFTEKNGNLYNDSKIYGKYNIFGATGSNHDFSSSYENDKRRKDSRDNRNSS